MSGVRLREVECARERKALRTFTCIGEGGSDLHLAFTVRVPSNGGRLAILPP